MIIIMQTFLTALNLLCQLYTVECVLDQAITLIYLSCNMGLCIFSLPCHFSCDDWENTCNVTTIKSEVWTINRSLQWRYNEHDDVSNHQPYNCLLNCLFGHRSKKTSKLHVTGLCEGNSPVTGEFPTQRANNAENVSIWWRHHVCR